MRKVFCLVVSVRDYSCAVGVLRVFFPSTLCRDAEKSEFDPTVKVKTSFDVLPVVGLIIRKSSVVVYPRQAPVCVAPPLLTSHPSPLSLCIPFFSVTGRLWREESGLFSGKGTVSWGNRNVIIMMMCIDVWCFVALVSSRAPISFLNPSFFFLMPQVDIYNFFALFS